MKRLPREALRRLWQARDLAFPVNRIAHEAVAEMVQMDADLMGAPGLQSAPDQGCAV